MGGLGLATAVRTSGYAVDPTRVKDLKVLAEWEFAVVDALAARICASDLPADAPGTPPTAREVGVTEWIDAYLAEGDVPTRRDVRLLIGCLEHLWPMLCGERRRFTSLPSATQDRVLGAMEASSHGLVSGAFHGLKSLCFMGYYRDPRTWGILGYDGPLVNRPEDGWTPRRYLVRGKP